MVVPIPWGNINKTNAAVDVNQFNLYELEMLGWCIVWVLCDWVGLVGMGCWVELAGLAELAGCLVVVLSTCIVFGCYPKAWGPICMTIYKVSQAKP